MNDPSANSSDDGFVPFRAATALARGEEGALDPAPRVPPPLPPPPPGAPVQVRVRPEPSAPVARVPGRPPACPPGTSRTEAWRALVDWCVEAGIAEGGLLCDRAGSLIETRGEVPARDPAFLARNLCAALAAAREVGVATEAAAALDLGGRWVTGFRSAGPDGADHVAVLWGPSPLRGPVRGALARWLDRAGA